QENVDARGSGVYLESSNNIVLSQNTIINNSSTGHGGGVYLRYSNNVSLFQNTIHSR
ncbi:MAG TPA: hypothetical protein ENH84_04495, partial [Phycisphaerae bacterium]|nr:hypothetical protein [Phycisphaerae bacterium]